MEHNPSRNSGILQQISFAIVNALERAFFWWGYNISLQPRRYVLACLLFVVISSFGFIFFRREQQAVRLWLPRNSEFVRDTDWLIQHYGETYRLQNVIVTAEDVLQPHVLLKLEEIHRKVVSLSVDGISWSDICLKVPAVSIDVSKYLFSSSSDTSDSSGADGRSYSTNSSSVALVANHPKQSRVVPEFDPSSYLSDKVYCSIVDTLEQLCFEQNLLEIWSYDRVVIKNLTKPDILRALNITMISPVYGHPVNYVPLLGGVKRTNSGFVMSAQAVRLVWVAKVNYSLADYEKSGNTAGTGDLGDAKSLSWEQSFVALMDELARSTTDMKILFSSGRSFGDISNDAMIQDLDNLFLGIIIMFIYIQIMLTKFNMIEIRLYLGIVGMMCIGMAMVVSFGICSLMGIFFGPVHNALPFLLLGIGVDDMFIIMQSWFNISPSDKSKSLPQRIGLVMKHAGTSITVTSITDFVAFIIGATTALPCLQSFCLYAAVGILATYVFQSTFFVACLVWDQRRIEQNRNGIVFCYRHKNYEPNQCSQRSFAKEIFNYLYSKLILTTPGKTIVLLSTVAITGIAIKGNFELKQHFDQMWFIPKNTHLANYTETRMHFYPTEGQEAGVYMGRLNYSAEFSDIQRLVETFKKQDDILYEVESWTDGFQDYMNKNFDYDLPRQTLSDSEFSKYISKYLFSPHGAKYQKNFRFSRPLVCGDPAPEVTVSSFDFKFRVFCGSEEHIPALHRVRNLVSSANLTTGDAFSTVWGKIFANWVTDEIIDHEMYRNLALAMLCVVVTTFLLIANIQTCLMVLACVLLTLVDVGGMMCFWGLTIDILSCLGLVLAVGLCVDYAAHIGLSFMSCTGSRNKRALYTVTEIGPAVLNGGVSTLLALSVLSNSQAHVFITFFKIFLLVVVFGLFHGVVVLPVVLSLVGPPPYHVSDSESQAEDSTRQTQIHLRSRDSLTNGDVSIHPKSLDMLANTDVSHNAEDSSSTSS